MRGRSRPLIGVLLSVVLTRPGAAEDLAVIVHAERDVRLSVEEVAQIYLKERRFWGDGARIVPVNRNSGSPAREAFVRLIFGREARLEVYWNRQYFRGVLPPATLASDGAVRRFVASERRAIGYVDPRMVDASVRVVLRLSGAGTRRGAAIPPD